MEMSKTGTGSQLKTDSSQHSTGRTATSESHAPPGELTAAQFEGLLKRLDADRNRAGEKYEVIRWKLVRFFQWNSCFAAEELVDETLNRLAEKVAAGGQEISDIAAYAWGIARNVKQEALRKDARTIHLGDVPSVETLAGNVPMDAADDLTQDQKRLKCLRMCIRRLSARDRTLLLSYHSPKGRKNEARKQLAKEAGVTSLALRVRVNRLRFKLEDCIRKRFASGTD
jgi:RNA polymerase sigma factor (sigma-70 family)